ncbi:MAG TPA: VCBS repeat-containing protein, partial [bacterium]|nr:VCBS repeat-containing protein [bacterium]
MLKRGLRVIYLLRHPGVCALLLVVSGAPAAAKTITLTATRSDTLAILADLQPLFGLPWKLITPPSALAHSEFETSFIDDQYGFLCTLDPEISPICQLWRYQRGRWQLEELAAFAGRPMTSLFARTRQDVWLSFNPDLTLKQDLLHYDGRSWRHISTPNSDRIRSLFMLSPTSGWAGCEWGQLMRYNGADWQLKPFPTNHHIRSLLMLDENTGTALTRAHRKENHLFFYNGASWRSVHADSLNWLALFFAMSTELGISNWPADMLTRAAWLEAPAAMQDTLLIDVPLPPGRLIFCHARGTLIKGRLARSFHQKRLDWIANYVQPPREEGRYVWLTVHFFNQQGDKRLLVLRLLQAPKRPALFDVAYLQSSSYNSAEHGMAIADFNGDGNEDVFAVVTGAANHLDLMPPPGSNQAIIEAAAKMGLAGSGTLTSGIVNYDEGAAAADVDNDGDQDLLVTSLYGHDLLYRQTAPGRFREECRFAGIDNCLARTSSAIWADVNRDGAIDLYLANEDSANHLYLNNGAGIFQDVTPAAGLRIDRGGGGPAFADIDDDGDPDLFVPRCGQPNLLFINDGPAAPDAVPHFSECARARGVAGSDTLTRSTSATWGDVDNDGDLDLFVTNLNFSNWLYLNDGRGHFEEVTATHGVASHDLSQTALFLDADNDGDLDLLTGNR